MYSMTQTQRQAMLQDIDANMPQLIRSVQELVRIPSVKEAAQPNMPLGKPIEDCLEAALCLGRKLGFSTKNLDGYVGLADSGQGEELLGVLCHLDVVPAGAGWTKAAPFSGEMVGQRIYGRGTMDDKGPAVCALYALHAVMAAGIPLKRKVRILLGCDEEEEWECIRRYKETEPLPSLSFSPDGTYPLVWAERSICHNTFGCADVSPIRIAAGERANVVPGAAQAWVPFAVSSQALEQREGFSTSCTQERNGTLIQVCGHAAHASTPEEGHNALLWLLQLLSKLPIGDIPGGDTICGLASLFSMDQHGEGFDLDVQDETGRLTLNLGILHWDEQGLRLTTDVRAPLCLQPEAVGAKLAAKLEPLGLAFQKDHIQPGHALPLEGELVETLLRVYRDVTGDSSAQPLAIGGATYARAFANAAAFGCERQGEPMLAHMPDEYISIQDLRFHTQMMAEAIAALAGA